MAQSIDFRFVFKAKVQENIEANNPEFPRKTDMNLSYIVKNKSNGNFSLDNGTVGYSLAERYYKK